MPLGRSPMSATRWILIDRDEVVRYWNRAAELLLQVSIEEAVGAPVADVVPGWDELTAHSVPADASGDTLAESVTVPVVIAGDERWLSVTAVDFGEGRVYALRGPDAGACARAGAQRVRRHGFP